MKSVTAFVAALGVALNADFAAADLRLGMSANIACLCGGSPVTIMSIIAQEHVNKRDASLCPAIAQIESDFNTEVYVGDQVIEPNRFE